MEDMKISAVMILVYPGVTFPLTYLLKWLMFKIMLKKVSKMPTQQMIWSAILESITPHLSFLTFVFIDVLSFFTKANYFDGDWHRGGLLLIIFLLFNCVTNYLFFARLLKKYYSDYLVRIIALGSIATTAFPIIGFSLGYFSR